MANNSEEMINESPAKNQGLAARKRRFSSEKFRSVNNEKMIMKEKMIELFNLKLIERTTWNEIYYSDTHVFVWNIAIKTWKIKPR